MRPSPLAAVLLLLAVSALAAAPGRPLPEDEAKGLHYTDGLCAISPTSAAVEVPEVKVPDDPSIPRNWKDHVRDATRDGRARLIAVARLTTRIDDGAATVVAATNECGPELSESLSVLSSTAQAAARGLVAASLQPWLPPDQPLAWTPVSLLKDAGAPRPDARYAAACRAPELDDALYAPEAPGLPAEARAKLAGIGATAATVSKALREQKAALDELLPLLEGFRCRETLAAFDAVTAQEQRAFFDYREKAVAGAVWGELKWTKESP